MKYHNIIVFGAAGRTGREVVGQALKKGYQVTAFVYRTPPADVLPQHNNLTIVQGNARNKSDVEKAIIGHDAVINIIAPRLFDAKNYDISLIATSNILEAMEKHGIQRYIGQCGAWATDQLQDASILMQIAFKTLAPFKGIYAYKKQEDDVIQYSHTHWTIVRCGVLTNNNARKKYHIYKQRYVCKWWEIPHVSRKNVATFELDILQDSNYFLKCPIIIER